MSHSYVREFKPVCYILKLMGQHWISNADPIEVTIMPICIPGSQQLSLVLSRWQVCAGTAQRCSHRTQKHIVSESMAPSEPQTPLANLLGKDSHNVNHLLIILQKRTVTAAEWVQAPAAVWWCAGSVRESESEIMQWSAHSSSIVHQARSHTRAKTALSSHRWCLCVFVLDACPRRHAYLLLTILYRPSAVYFCILNLLKIQRCLGTSHWQMCFDNTQRDKHLVSGMSLRDTSLFTPTLLHRGDT